jgi:hypothetical protein
VTFAEAFRALAAIAEGRGDQIMLEVNAWSRGPAQQSTIQWQCWSVKQGKHFCGETADQCVAAYIHGVAQYAADLTPEALEAVGDAVLL